MMADISLHVCSQLLTVSVFLLFRQSITIESQLQNYEIQILDVNEYSQEY